MTSTTSVCNETTNMCLLLPIVGQMDCARRLAGRPVTTAAVCAVTNSTASWPTAVIRTVSSSCAGSTAAPPSIPRTSVWTLKGSFHQVGLWLNSTPVQHTPRHYYTCTQCMVESARVKISWVILIWNLRCCLKRMRSPSPRGSLGVVLAMADAWYTVIKSTNNVSQCSSNGPERRFSTSKLNLRSVVCVSVSTAQSADIADAMRGMPGGIGS